MFWILFFISTAFAADYSEIPGEKKRHLIGLLEKMADHNDEAPAFGRSAEVSEEDMITKEDLPPLLENCRFKKSHVAELVPTFFPSDQVCEETLQLALQSGVTVEEMWEVVAGFYVISNERPDGKVVVW